MKIYIDESGSLGVRSKNQYFVLAALVCHNKVADKNIRLLPQFREKYPEYKNACSKISDIHDKLVIEVMETDDDKKDKIIYNIFYI